VDRSLLMIPGPIEFEPDVLAAMAGKTDSHVAPRFVERFGGCLRDLRDVFRAPDGQPFVVAGSGTLAMEMAVANLVEPGDPVLVVNTGYFSDRFAQMLERYGATVAQARAPVGAVPSLDEVANLLEQRAYKALFATHVDTSTGVRVDTVGLARLAREHDLLSVVDGVCATAGERFEQAEWDVDVYLTASQKAIGVPPGLAILIARPGALERWRGRREPARGLYTSWDEWLPIMQAYEEERPAYFATPPVNLINALAVSLRHILREGMEARWARHERVATAFRAAWEALGLRAVPSPDAVANTLSALYYPDGVDAAVLGKFQAEGVVVAGGLHPEIRTRYFRVGHMGAVSSNDVLATVGAIERGLRQAGYHRDHGVAVAAAQKVLNE
jgi:alanine-glyoxylate transaminase / serine-glyoxylate transaminase / serine-pyruvate transaminase